MQIIKEYVKDQKLKLKEKIKGLNRPINFAIVQVGNVEASNRYIKNKIKDCEEVGITTQLFKYPENISESFLHDVIDRLNYCNTADAIIIQFPLPKHINEKKVMSWLEPKKDADGFTNNGITNPATPQGIISYLERQDFDFENKNALVLGRSEIVGKPMQKLLLNKNCNVMQIHSKTSLINKIKMIQLADLIICATGHKNTIISTDFAETKEEMSYFMKNEPLDYMIKDKLVFDVGINFNDEGKLVGDCEKNLPVKFQSTVPGGVGLLTRLQLLENVVRLAETSESVIN